MSKTEDSEKPKDENDDTGNPLLMLHDLLGDGPDKEPLRKIGIIGDIPEDKTSDILYGMLSLHDSRVKETLKDPEDPESGVEKVSQPFEMIISTNGGDAREMAAIYDTMRHIRKDCDIETLALGKVMSAGTLILAAGTKGKRKIGKNCRVMIHSVNAGSVGELHNIENEVKAIKQMQDLYINAMCNETQMTKRQIQKLIDRKINVYLTAEEAIEYGIADEIL